MIINMKKVNKNTGSPGYLAASFQKAYKLQNMSLLVGNFGHLQGRSKTYTWFIRL